jgi:hypothetical protein
LAYHGGSVELNAANNYELDLNGDTGISAGVKDELNAIIGQPRMIPIFKECQFPGNNAQYTIVHWWGVRIMEVKLTGPMNKKRVMIQLARVITRGGIETSDDVQTSTFVYSPAWLIR